MKFIFSVLFALTQLTVAAQDDSRAYENQRKRINGLLDARSAKFGQFEKSLGKHTGIFGLKTKKDMQRSIDILSEIFRTDNNIFKETKVLLEFKDFEKTEVQSKATENEQRMASYMTTITRLQNQEEKLKATIKTLEDQKGRYLVAVFALTGMLLLLFYWARKRGR